MKNFYYDLQAELVKNWEDTKRIVWGENSDYVFYTMDGVTGWYIPKLFFIINKVDMMIKKTPTEHIESFVKPNDETGYKDAYMVGTKKLESKNITILSDKNGETEVWIDSKFFKKVPRECALKIKGKKDMVRVYWHDAFCGIICPIAHHGD